MDGLKVKISESLRTDFEAELHKEKVRLAGMRHGTFDVADAMDAFDRIFEVVGGRPDSGRSSFSPETDGEDPGTGC